MTDAVTAPPVKQVKVNKLEELTSRIRNISKSANAIVPVLDFEMYEHTHEILTEVGITLVDFSTATIVSSEHLIIKEHIEYRNGTYVPDNKFNFLFGTVQVVKIENATNRLREVSTLHNGQLALHGAAGNDTKILSRLKVKHPRLIDTQYLYSVIHNVRNNVSLKRMCETYDVRADMLHNAGNDTRYTAMCLVKMIQSLLGK